jgi:hypothetical protein
MIRITCNCSLKIAHFLPVSVANKASIKRKQISHNCEYTDNVNISKSRCESLENVSSDDGHEISSTVSGISQHGSTITITITSSSDDNDDEVSDDNGSSTGVQTKKIKRAEWKWGVEKESPDK